MLFLDEENKLIQKQANKQNSNFFFETWKFNIVTSFIIGSGKVEKYRIVCNSIWYLAPCFEFDFGF